LTTKKQRIAGVLKRFQFIDLARAVAATGLERRAFLEKYTNRPTGRFSTYSPFRKCIGGAYGVERALDTSPRLGRPELETAIRKACKGFDEGMNVDAGLCLHDLLAQDDYSAFDHPERSLRLADDRFAAFGLGHYLVRGDEAVFQFPYPRRTRLTDFEFLVMMSLIQFAYVRDDFESAVVEICDLSCIESSIRLDGRRVAASRSPRVLRLPVGGALEKAELEAEIQDVYTVLMALADEPE
jgi:hypothetical protein